MDIIDETFKEDPSHFPDAGQLLSTVKDKLQPLMSTAKYLTQCTARSGDLVRFRGMVQNSHGIEMYAPVFNVDFDDGTSLKMTGVCRDGAGLAGGTLRVDEMAPTSARMVYNVVPIPGEAAWSSAGTTDENDDGTDCGLAKRLKLDDAGPQLHTIRVYTDSEEFLQHQIVDFYGIYYEPTIELEEDSGQSVFGYPSIHVIEHRLPSYAELVPQLSQDQGQVHRDYLVELTAIMTSLLGSELSARYFLQALVSHTYSWSENTAVPLCSMPLNIVGVRNSRCIIETLRVLMPMVQVLSITKSTLEDKPLYSVKDHETDGLSVAPLQMARGTVLVLDCTEYKERAVSKPDNFLQKNLDALRLLVEEQKIAYDFGVFQHAVQTDITIIALTAEGSPFFKSALRVKSVSFEDGVDPSAELRKLSPDVLHGYRRFLLESRERVRTIDIPTDVQREVCQSFTSLREAYGADAAEHFRNLLSLARLQTALEQKSIMNAETYHACARREKERLDALKQTPR
ncbi:mini-chromosome maintenance complex-binding protein-like protein [Aphelenchoides avenae]|nr:mini-chromosome maintenance complex-binding protein-like protein [Aphelenchus avenae]